jgi:hypothetical protein
MTDRIDTAAVMAATDCRMLGSLAKSESLCHQHGTTQREGEGRQWS